MGRRDGWAGVSQSFPSSSTPIVVLTVARSSTGSLPSSFSQSSSPYKGGKFKLSVEFANDYPFKGEFDPARPTSVVLGD